ncbi:cytochrome P450 [Aspergillus brunneoviolaceus CBS 621.78]|uniref:Cytochrome P450 n=1 Tax=Aspergillus brunneoviolaceus CBS 621.78 TaxID=1450534 RepID=A0ACD1GMY1_9EURO|nr:cytochrome P450 [Aspergillus brunneoviolaceus CBS 621.78]RAH50530.1 cytochrome P450 [Aspergillus brunneoviolaceus CBS 621.78]
MFNIQGLSGLYSPSSTAWVLLAGSLGTILFYTVALVLYNVYLHPLARYPGPTAMAATRIPYMRLTIGGRFPQTIKQLHERYGKVVRIAPNELSFTDREAWKAIYGTRPRHGQKGKDFRFYSPTAGGAPSIIVSNDADHSRFRRLMAHGFSDSSLRGQEPIIYGNVDLLMQRLQEKCEEGEVVDLVKWYNFTTFDIIRDLAFGEPFDRLPQELQLSPMGVKTAAYANVARRLPGSLALLKLITPKHIIAEKDIHAALTTEKHENTEKGFTTQELVSNGSTIIIAGSETTATLLSGVTYLLLKSPRVLSKLQDEIRSTFSDESEIDLESCNKLEYCLAVLTEALRVYPPVGPGLPRIVDAQGDMIAGNWVPGGTIVSISQLAANHSSDNFTDPERFIPERHLGDPRFANDSKTAMQPFSFGPRNCIGRNLAYVEMRLILARMVFNFDMELDQPGSDWLHQECFLLWQKPSLPVKSIPRHK